jgi:DNA-binding NarL/FixJ family response regulator
MTVSIVIADDFPALRTGVRAWLEDHADFQVIGEAKDGPETIRLVTRLQPQVLVIDMHMPGLNGTDVLALIGQQSLRTRGVVFSNLPQEEYVVEALRKGALAYVLKTSAAQVLVQAVRCALQERAWYQTGDIITLADRRYDHVSGRLEVEYTWIRNGRTGTRPSTTTSCCCPPATFATSTPSASRPR